MKNFRNTAFAVVICRAEGFIDETKERHMIFHNILIFFKLHKAFPEFCQNIYDMNNNIILFNKKSGRCKATLVRNLIPC